MINGAKVPDVLLNGNHRLIEEWRDKQALGKTWKSRPDLLDNMELNDRQRKLLKEFIAEST